MLNLIDFFHALEKENYCIIKLDPIFPMYRKGSDIDIFCFNIKKTLDRILYIGNSYLNEGYNINIESRSNSHTHVDFMTGDAIDLRFDLYQQLPHYKNINIKQALFDVIIENRRDVSLSDSNRKITIYVPDYTDELLLRYIEYQEWYAQIPDKIKHLDYILNSSNDKNLLLNRLHHYTKLPNPGSTEEQNHQLIKQLTDKKKSNLKLSLKSFFCKVKKIPSKHPKEILKVIEWNIRKYFL